MKTSKDERSFSPAYFASVGCYLLGIFSKEMAITLPLLIFLYDLIFTKVQSLSYKLTRYYTGYILATIFYLLMRFVVLHNPVESHVSYPGGSIFINFLTMSKVLASYMKLFFVLQLFAQIMSYPIPHHCLRLHSYCLYFFLSL